jgi:hypothetical protein
MQTHNWVSIGNRARILDCGWDSIGHLIRSAALRGITPAFCLLLPAFFFLSAAAQEPEPEPPPPNEFQFEEEQPLPGDWAVALLDKISNSSGPEANAALLRAMMAAGPTVVPLLEEALKDDRTAEFAAQALAYIGGEKALKLLWEHASDPRDLNLRRFYYGALGEFDVPEASETLLNVIRRADSEPDRTVTEAAILALTVRSDPKLLPPLREMEQHIVDVVIRLDLENAIEVIERRAKHLAATQKKAGGSIDHAVRTYFAPALESVPPPAAQLPPAPKPSSTRTAPAKPAARAAPPEPAVKVQIENITLSPDKTRALVRAVFEDPSASANYDIVLQKHLGDWMVASVWLGSEIEKVPSRPDIPKPSIE